MRMEAGESNLSEEDIQKDPWSSAISLNLSLFSYNQLPTTIAILRGHFSWSCFALFSFHMLLCGMNFLCFQTALQLVADPAFLVSWPPQPGNCLTFRTTAYFGFSIPHFQSQHSNISTKQCFLNSPQFQTF